MNWNPLPETSCEYVHVRSDAASVRHTVSGVHIAHHCHESLVAFCRAMPDLRCYKYIIVFIFFASFTTRLLRYILRTVLAYVQNAPGILVRFSRTNFIKLFIFIIRVHLRKIQNYMAVPSL